ncbi:MAG: 2-succinyl-5-enolpyruvyl-6-hydroxy-3-cyclohexene-1-carboxylic-acid synthase [Bacteroidales bacterium]|jgi:2-succinyl-5-enolpyruvyl-6-hydroxy-3-cyclohexene-1-carboxylate synthase|nr:2-succinyl-5-enolpyruvyl-6-hydroxy-3-cyclohexene-1-carboxylic-acid synthase [Bacteroidales bacterium]
MNASYSDLESVRLLVDLLERRGVRHVVLSPGSRNAPLLVSVARSPILTHHVVADERAAAFFALGMARQSGNIAAMVSTSGTAVLNYAPAVAEAYYQGIPLLVISADRPPEQIDQDDNQTIRQHGALAHFVKGSFPLPADVAHDAGRRYVNRLINEAINLAREGRPGPVHLNLPLREPLYGFGSPPPERQRVIAAAATETLLTEETLFALRKRFAETQKVMIVAGFHPPDEELREAVRQAAAFGNVAVLAETLSNLKIENTVTPIDRTLACLSPEELPACAPDLLITFGGAPVSRRIRALIAENPPQEHWHIDRRSLPPDTYRRLSLHVNMQPAAFLRQLCDGSPSAETGYAALWREKQQRACIRQRECMKQAAWSDLKAFSLLLPAIPEDCLLHLGNSTPVRYAQLFAGTRAVRTDGNRGVSGIEGAVSTAAGAAAVSDKTVALVTGDLSLLYDSNALWACPASPRLKIIVMLNGGGGIFRLLPGASTLEETGELLETPHGVDVRQLAQLHRFELFSATDAASLQAALETFFLPASRPAMLVIDTAQCANGEILKRYFESLKINV